MSGGILSEVRDFVAALREELPELFVPPPAPSRPRPRQDPRLDARAFAARCEHYAPRLGVAYGRVRAKRMTSLWGSCSPRGDLSFNAALLEAPPEVLDYVVVHELAHLRWRGHGRRFWDLVARHCPEHGARRRWLRRHGARLLGQEAPGLVAADAVDDDAPDVGNGVPRQREVEAAG